MSDNKSILDCKLTEDQKECIKYEGEHLLIKGVAGSGKTLVLMRKAIKLKEDAEKKGESVKIVIFTYNKALKKYSTQLLQAVGKHDGSISVETLHSRLWNILRDNGLLKKNFNDKQKKDIISKAKNRQIDKRNDSNRLYELDYEFWKDEFAWIKGKNLLTSDDYIKSGRKGRGSSIRMSDKDKVVAFDLFKEYEKILEEKGYFEFDDFAPIFVNKVTSYDSYKYDYILVDEAQDLSFVQMIAVKKLAKKGLTIAADHNQKIYKNYFTWKELGINIQGQASKQLKRNFRSTKKIVMLAESLKNHNKVIDEDDKIVSVLPDEEGIEPEIYKCSSAVSENIIIEKLLNRFDYNKNVVGILYRTWNEKREIENLLKEKNIPYEDIGDKDSEWNLVKHGVKLVTMHSSKGLEFDYVIIPKVNSGVIPKEMEDPNGDIEEHLSIERNLMYVSMTRAKSQLAITCTNDYSQFIDEFDLGLYKLTNV